MKIGADVYFICDGCSRCIKKGDSFYSLQHRVAGVKFAHEREHKKSIHLCEKCLDRVIQP